MKTGDLISFVSTAGKLAGRKVLGTVIQAPGATDGSMVIVKALDGTTHQFDAWLDKWETISDAASPKN